MAMALDVDESFPYGQMESHGFPIKRSLCFIHRTYISFLNVTYELVSPCMESNKILKIAMVQFGKWLETEKK
jgi:hypothetical protein